MVFVGETVVTSVIGWIDIDATDSTLHTRPEQTQRRVILGMNQDIGDGFIE